MCFSFALAWVPRKHTEERKIFERKKRDFYFSKKKLFFDVIAKTGQKRTKVIKNYRFTEDLQIRLFE